MQLHCTLCQLYMPIHSCCAIKQYREEQLSCWAMLCQYFFLYHNRLQFKFFSSRDIQYKVPGIHLFCYSYIFNAIAQKPNPGNMLDFFLIFPWRRSKWNMGFIWSAAVFLELHACCTTNIYLALVISIGPSNMYLAISPGSILLIPV